MNYQSLEEFILTALLPQDILKEIGNLGEAYWPKAPQVLPYGKL